MLLFDSFPIAGRRAFPANRRRFGCNPFALGLQNAPGFQTRFNDKTLGVPVGLFAFRE